MSLNERLLELKAEQRDTQNDVQKQINEMNAKANALEFQAKDIREEVQVIANEANNKLVKIEGKIEEVNAMMNAGMASSNPNGTGKQERSRA